MPNSFDTIEVTGGVWAFVAPGTSGPAVSNAAAVDLGDKTVVVDTFMTMSAAKELAAEVRRLTGREAFLVVNSHWHSDHVRGNRAFESVPIVGTQRMIELIAEDAPASTADLEATATALTQHAESLAAAASTEEERSQAAGVRALGEAIAEEAPSYRLVLPSVLIGDRLVIEGERSLVIEGRGRGHTESDLFVHVPDGRVVISGDLVWTGIHPKTSDGFPGEWADVVDGLAALRPVHVVPGHGPPGGPSDLDAMSHYLRAVAALLSSIRDGDLDPGAAPAPAGSEAWQDLSRFHAGLAQLALRT